MAALLTMLLKVQRNMEYRSVLLSVLDLKKELTLYLKWIVS